jgi:hypothetical protein
LRRYEGGGVAALRDGNSRPHTSPNATRAEVVGKIVYLRQTYHFGPHKIAMYLERYHHDLRVSPSGIWRILERLDTGGSATPMSGRRHPGSTARSSGRTGSTPTSSTSSSTAS